jgi:hypothetical protein
MISVSSTIGALFRELVDGRSSPEGYILNPDDVGLLRSLDRLSAGVLDRATVSGDESLRSLASSVAHLAYHFGAIRQLADAARGPLEPQL